MPRACPFDCHPFFACQRVHRPSCARIPSKVAALNHSCSARLPHSADPEHVIEISDTSIPFMPRVEVVDARSGAHLGHVFNDGPRPTGKR